MTIIDRLRARIVYCPVGAVDMTVQPWDTLPRFYLNIYFNNNDSCSRWIFWEANETRWLYGKLTA